MKKALLTTLTAFVFVFANAQFTVEPGVNKAITINGTNYRIFVPSDYNTGSNYYFHIAFYGDNNTSHASLLNHVPGNQFISPHNWDGSVHLNNGTVAKFIVFSITAHGIQPDMYGAAIDSVFKVLGNKVNVNDSSYFSASGFSGGPGRMWSYLINASSSKRLLFKNTISMSPTSLGIDVTARSSTGRHWVWYSSWDDNTEGTPPSAAINLYNDIGSTEKILTNQQMSDSCHCGEIWDSCMSTAGLALQNGGTASTNRWRWLVDPNDGLSSPPSSSFPFVVGQLRQKTYSSKNFLYYIPDTAQRSTLRYYFIYNIIDTVGKDSAYAVQRGLAKKYKNGWNGKVPLCNGDTAVFAMLMQLQNPHLKADMELGIQLALDSLPNHVFDTANSQRMKNILTGIGRGPTTQLTYLLDRFSTLGQGTANFRQKFGVFVSVDQHDNGQISTPGWATLQTPFKSWWWTSNLSSYPYMPSTSRTGKDSADNRNPGALTRITELANSYSSATWDSAYSTAGNNASNNVFHWIIDTSNCVTDPPPGPEGPFAVGQLRKKTYNNRELLYYVPDTAQRATLKYYFLYNMVDVSGQDSAYAVQRGLAKKYKNGWNGKLALCNGDTAIFTMVTQIQNPHLKADMETGIQWALDSLPNHLFDTAYANRMKNVFTGIGHGPHSEVNYLMNKFALYGQGTSTFRKSFGVLVSLDQKDNGSIYSNGWSNIETPLKSWWWTSNLSSYPYNPGYTRDSKDSADNYNSGALTKITEIAASYSQTTWDSAYSTAGNNPSNNVFHWIVDTAACGGARQMFTGTKTIAPAETGELTLTPNPVKDVLNIGWTGEAGKVNMLVTDMQGRILYRKQLPSAKGFNIYQLSTGMLANGEYLLSLSTGNKVFAGKFLKY